MKQILIIMMLLLISIGIVNAEDNRISNNIKNIPECTGIIHIQVNATLEIAEGEYIIKGCNDLTNNSWGCNCTNPTSLTLLTNQNTINNYSFLLKYTSTVYTEEQVLYHGGGGRSSYYNPLWNTTSNMTMNTTTNTTINTTTNAVTNITEIIIQNPIENITTNDTIVNETEVIYNQTIVPIEITKEVGFFERIWNWIKGIFGGE